METKAIKFNVNNGKADMFVVVEFEKKFNTSHAINSIKEATKKFNNSVMKDLKIYPKNLIAIELKDYLNEICNVNITNVSITNLKFNQIEMDM